MAVLYFSRKVFLTLVAHHHRPGWESRWMLTSIDADATEAFCQLVSRMLDAYSVGMNTSGFDVASGATRSNPGRETSAELYRALKSLSRAGVSGVRLGIRYAVIM
jgi:hypothetical protein